MFNNQFIKDLLSLSKVMISVSITYSALAGYVIAGHKIDIQIIPILIGIFILSSGASAFNHIAERKTDSLMPRTQNRPIPSGRISVKFASEFAIIASLTGIIILVYTSGWIVAVLGTINLLWYILIYTPLKKRTVWAVFIGTITGVIPFYMGYLSSACEFPSHSAHFIAFFLLIWQIPHFFLLLGIYGKEYELAGLAAITKKTEEDQLFKLSAVWILASCVITILLPLFNISHYKLTGYLIIAIALSVFIISLFSLVFNINKKFKFLFIVSNLMQLSVVTCLVIDNVVQISIP